jgi:hypothetical protein
VVRRRSRSHASCSPTPARPGPTARFKTDAGPYLPLLDRMRPIDEGGDDMESGTVGTLPHVAAESGLTGGD